MDEEVQGGIKKRRLFLRIRWNMSKHMGGGLRGRRGRALYC